MILLGLILNVQFYDVTGCKPPCSYYKYDVVNMLDGTGIENGTGVSYFCKNI